jgi:hypothetical protein
VVCSNSILQGATSDGEATNMMIAPDDSGEGNLKETEEAGMKPSEPQSHTIFTQNLFNGIAGSYDRWAQILTLFQYLSWRKFLVSKMTLQPDYAVLDSSTGTAGVAVEIARRYG